MDVIMLPPMLTAF